MVAVLVATIVDLRINETRQTGAGKTAPTGARKCLSVF